MALQESGEMYLETIYILLKENPTVRAIDVGEYMGFSKPSVSRAMGLLKDSGYVSTDGSGYMFASLGVDRKTAAEDACKIEHVISDDTFSALKQHFGQKK